MTLTLVTGDTRPTLTGVCYDGTTPADLTGATVHVHVVTPDGTIIDRATTTTPGPSGAWSLSWQAGDLAKRGTYRVEIEATYSDQSVQTFHLGDTGPLIFSVVDQYA